MVQPSFTVERVDREGSAELRLAGRLALSQGDELWRQVRRQTESTPESLRVDLSAVESMDGASAALLIALQVELRQRGVDLEFANAREDVQRMLTLYGCPEDLECLHSAPSKQGQLDQIGHVAIDALSATRGVLEFIGDMAVSTAAAFRAPRTVNWGVVGKLMERAGADGLVIVLLINFLIGLIMALQSAPQLQQFGADIFVADLVGKSMTRELGPLMTAIIVAGRSGAAFAAELGTMKVSEEVDALRTLGLDPQRYLVFPRVLALALVVPILTMLAIVIGCVGGLVIATTSLNLTPVSYLNQMNSALDMSYLLG